MLTRESKINEKIDPRIIVKKKALRSAYNSSLLFQSSVIGLVYLAIQLLGNY